MIHSCAELTHIGKANAEFQQGWKFMRLIPAWRDANVVDCAPEAITGMGIIMPHVGGPLPGSGPDKDQS
jgi:hypothetical protein